MSTDEVKTHQRYQFKPSRIALGFQLLCLTVIFYCAVLHYNCMDKCIIAVAGML